MLFEEPIKKNQTELSQPLIISLLIASLLLGAVGGALTVTLMNNFGGHSEFAKNVNTAKQEQQIQNILVQEESETINVVEKARPSVVSIVIYQEKRNLYNYTGPFMFEQFFGDMFPFEFLRPGLPQPENNDKNGKEWQRAGGGSGFIISEDGMILTNKHVVADESAKYEVVTDVGEIYEAKVLARDTVNDLAVLKIEAHGLKPLELGDSDNLKIGQTVVAIGYALAEYNNTVTKGVISGIGRKIVASDGYSGSEVLEEVIQTDAAINPGNSGGPLLDLSGKVIGINTAVSQQGQLIGFAIPINQVKKVVESIKIKGKIVRPFLGVRYVIINKAIAEKNSLKVDYGALIVAGRSVDDLAVIPGSPADKAGLEANDIILELNGQKIDENHSLVRLLSDYMPGDEIELKILHDDQEKTVKVKLEERKE